MPSLLRKIFEEASVHGFPYVVERKFHWIERLFWIITLILATYFSISICLNQWNRFQSNPIVYTVEKNFKNILFPYVGVTMCSNYYDHEKNEEIVKRIWEVLPSNASNGADEYNYYMKFLRVLSSLRYDNLKTLKPYEKDATLDNIPLLNISVDMRSNFATKLINLPLKNVTNKKQNVYSIVYVTAVTEVGICLTNSLLHPYTEPSGERKHFYVNEAEICRFFDVCSLKISELPGDGSKVDVYMHHVNDIVDPMNSKILHVEMIENKTLLLDLELPLMMSENEVRNLPITYRKCRYPDESNLTYYKIYRQSFCRIECFIKAALRLCNCKPFFYVGAAESESVCNLKGLMCLVRNNWTQTTCPCFPLCVEVSYARKDRVENKYDQNKLERVALITMHLPYMAIKRRVVFSTDELIVSFGGAISFFLGCSFMTFGEIFCFITEHYFQKIKKKIQKGT